MIAITLFHFFWFWCLRVCFCDTWMNENVCYGLLTYVVFRKTWREERSKRTHVCLEYVNVILLSFWACALGDCRSFYVKVVCFAFFFTLHRGNGRGTYDVTRVILEKIGKGSNVVIVEVKSWMKTDPFMKSNCNLISSLPNILNSVQFWLITDYPCHKCDRLMKLVTEIGSFVTNLTQSGRKRCEFVPGFAVIPLESLENPMILLSSHFMTSFARWPWTRFQFLVPRA